MIHRLLTAQRGLITRRQALTAGLSATTITDRLAAKHWFRVLPGVYRHCAATVDDELMARGALLWAGPAGVLCGEWAAWWHGLAPAPAGPIGVTVPRESALRSRDMVVIRRRDLDPLDVVVVRELRVVTRAVAALECAGQRGGGGVLDRALQRHVTPAELVAAMESLAFASGAAAARRALVGRLDGTVSHPERQLAKAFRGAGLTEVKAGVKIRIGGRLFWLDFAVVRLRLGIEVDGFVVHTMFETFEKDREKSNLLSAHDWLLLRYSAHRVDVDIDGIVDEVATIIAQRGG